jgi:signal transduction histidine kinase
MKIQRRTLPFLLIVCCTAVAAIIALVSWWEAARQNRYSIDAQMAIADSETANAYLAMQGKLSLEANWQTAYENVVENWNQAWIDSEYGSYLQGVGIRNVAVFGPQGRLRYFGREENSPLTERDVASAGGMKDLISSVWQVGKGMPPKEGRGTVVIDGKVYFAVAAAITPNDTAEAPRDPARHYTLVYLAPAETDVYDALSAGLKAKDVRLTVADPPRGYAAAALKDAAGKPRAYVVWKPYLPGSEFLAVLLPALVVTFVGLTVALAVMTYRWRRAQMLLLDAEAQASARQEEQRLKAAFIGNISHELRTPLNAVIGFSEMLKTEAFGPLGSKRNADYVDNILDAGRALLRLINDLIELSRIEARDTATERQIFDAAPAVVAAAEEISNHAEERKVTLSGPDRTEGVWCLGSDLNLRHAVARFLENAVDVTGPGGSVTLVWTRKDGEMVLAIGDGGDYMRPEALRQRDGRLTIYSENHMVSNKTHIGVNFNIAQGLVALMGGKVVVKTTHGAGNTVFLHLPVAAAPYKRASAVA